jgi:FXSXX-COOH protein
MDDHTEEDDIRDIGLVDLTDTPLSILRRRDDEPFSDSLQRIVEESDDPATVMVVGFQSAI